MGIKQLPTEGAMRTNLCAMVNFSRKKCVIMTSVCCPVKAQPAPEIESIIFFSLLVIRLLIVISIVNSNRY